MQTEQQVFLTDRGIVNVWEPGAVRLMSRADCRQVLRRIFLKELALLFAAGVVLALIGAVLLSMTAAPAHSQVIRHKALFHATDCTSLTGKKANQFCFQIVDNTWWVCKPSSGDCDTPGEWVEPPGTATSGGWTDDGAAVRLTTISDSVGIGTSSPLGKLHVNSSTDPITLQVQTTATNGRVDITLKNDAQTTSWRLAADDSFNLFDTTAGTFPFSVAAAAPTDSIRVLASGSVGFRVPPVTDHHIQESTTDTVPTVEVEQLSTGDAALQFSIVGDAYALGIDNTDDKFKISYAAGAGTAVLGTGDLVTIDPSGDVTIPILTSKIDRNTVAVSDDDCTGDQGRWWYDTTDGRFEFCNAGAGAPAILAGGGGAGAFADAADPVVLHSVGKDVVIGPAQVNTSKLTVDGDADQVQVTIQENATQNEDVFVIEDSGGTELFVIEAGGSIGSDVGIGIAAPDGTLHVHTASAGAVTANAAAADLVVEDSTDAGISILAPDADFASLVFGSPSDDLGATLSWRHIDGVLTLSTNNSGAELRVRTANNVLAITIDSSQTVTIEDLFAINPKASAPATCSIGDFYVDTSGAACACSAANTWSNMHGTGTCV